MAARSTRRTFVEQAGGLLAALQASGGLLLAADAPAEFVTATTGTGQVRGTVDKDIKIFKGIPYGGN